jgi:ferredoxin-NADP reductase
VSPSQVPVVVRQVRCEASNVVSLMLERADGGELPAWEAGAHVEVTLPSGRIRHYSLCGAFDERTSYRIAVLRQPAGRGGSIEVHDTALVGRELVIRGPRNHFRLGQAESYVFVAGGIGVTPILSMARQATERDAPWSLSYGGKTRASMSFTAELEALARQADARLALVPEDVQGVLSLAEIVRNAPRGAAICSCGPAGMLSALRATAAELRPEIEVRYELFTAPDADLGGDGLPDQHDHEFTVVLAQTGGRVTIADGTTILDAVRAVRPDVPYACEEGCCGTCETPVISGSPVHRDTVLTAEDRVANESMMICVGSCSSTELVLDL